MAIELPMIPSIPNYRMSTTIDGEVFILDVRWNDRDQSWYMDLLQADETPIVLDMRIVLGVYLGRRSTDPNMPQGGIIAQDLSGQGIEAGFDDLGIRVVLRFFTFEELVELG